MAELVVCVLVAVAFSAALVVCGLVNVAFSAADVVCVFVLVTIGTGLSATMHVTQESLGASVHTADCAPAAAGVR